MTQPTTFVPGTVYFAGAGPGDVELLTLKARRLIENADLILYAGSLVNPAVLEFARPDAVRMNAIHLKLAEQVQAMVSAARAGQVVARLHTGDPSIYGALAEQTQALRAHGVPYEIIPGVSSVFAAAAALGIEYTLPERTQTLILTRMPGKTPVPESENIRSLAVHRASLVVFLSTGMIDAFVAELLAAGYASSTPIAVVYRASWHDQRIVRGTLATIGAQVAQEELTHQGLIIVSPALEQTPTAPSHLYTTFQQSLRTREGTAIIALTAPAVQVGRCLFGRMPETTLYIPTHFGREDEIHHPRIQLFAQSVRQVLHDAFYKHQALICVMASGIVVRELAPLLTNKHSDPAVVVVDGRGQFAISLLSGHEGGANQLALKVANLLNGQAVITTASDGAGIPPLDVIAKKQGWRMHPHSDLAAVMAALVNGEAVGVVRDADLVLPEELSHVPWIPLESVQMASAHTRYLVVITYHQAEQALQLGIPVLVYHPPVLVVGVGCNRGTGADEIDQAIQTTLADARLAPASVTCLATIEDKANEPGLIEVVNRYGCSLQTVTREQVCSLADVTSSEYAQKALGVPAVAEPAARLIAGSSHLLVSKRKFPNVTVAVARKENRE